jgi:2,3-bisphosphoglycerate-dependent phosphoglycerate mutase
MTKAKLVILRHGQTEYNKLHLITGQKDVPLTEVGEEQAREAGALISHIRFDKVYSSNLSRAFNTAALALKASGTQVHLLNEDGTWQIEQCKAIVEIDAGDFEGRNHKTDPVVADWLRTYDVPRPGGESDKQAVERVQKFFDSEVMPRLLRGENVLVVAHAGIVRAFDFVLGIEDVPTATSKPPRRRVPNAAPTVYEYEDGVMTSFHFIENPKERDAANQNIPPPAADNRKNGPRL